MRRTSSMTAAATALAVSAAIAAGCGSGSHGPSAPAAGSDRPIAQFNVGIAGSVSNLDPARLTGTASVVVDNLGLENLMKIGSNGAVEPNLAESVSHPNPLTYVYTLRKGVRFWDGNELTAADVANAMNHYRNPKFQSAAYYSSVRSIAARGRSTVVVSLKRPDATWAYTPAFEAQIFEKRFGDAHRSTLGQPGVLSMGTGPWKFASLDPTRGAELVRNDRYWGKKPAIRRISIKFFSDETNEALAFRAGQIDLAFPLDARTFASSSGASITSVPSCDIALLSMNYHLPPWSDVHVRRAVAYAVDKAAVARAVGTGVSPLSQIIPPKTMEHLAPKSRVNALYASLASYGTNLAKARHELAQSKYPHGFSATINSTSSRPVLGLIDQVLAADLRKIGINLHVANLPVSQWLAEFYGPRNKIPILTTTVGCAIPDPSWYPTLFLLSANARPQGTNIADYTNPAVDKLIAAGLSTDNPAQRFAAYTRLLRIVASDVPYVPLFTQSANLALSKKFVFPGFSSVSVAGTWAQAIRSAQ